MRPCSCGCSPVLRRPRTRRCCARPSGRTSPVVVVQTGTEVFDIPYVLATEVVMCSPGSGFPVEEIARAIAARIGESGTGLAARLPAVREPLSEALIEKFSRQNAIAAVAIFIPGADFPVLTLNQIRLVLRLGGRARGRGRPGSLAGGARHDRRRAWLPCRRPPAARRDSRGRLAREGHSRVRGYACRRRGRASLFPLGCGEKSFRVRAGAAAKRPPLGVLRDAGSAPADPASCANRAVLSGPGPSVLGTPIWREAKWLVPSTPRNC